MLKVHTSNYRVVEDHRVQLVGDVDVVTTARACARDRQCRPREGTDRIDDDRSATARDSFGDVADGVGNDDACAAADAVRRVAQPLRIATNQYERVLSRREFRRNRAAAAHIRAANPDLVRCGYARATEAVVAK